MGIALAETEIQQAVNIVYKQAPNAGPEAQRIWEKGRAGWEGADQKEGWYPTPLPKGIVASVEDVRRNAFFFIQLWGRESRPQDDKVINPVACESHYQPGLVTCDEDIERLEGFKSDVVRNFVVGLGQSEYLMLNFGLRKRIVLIEADISAEEMRRRLFEAPNKPYEQYFPHLVPAQQEIQSARRNFEPTNSQRPFVDVFHGKVDGLWRGFKENNSEFFEWGYEEMEGKLYGINLDVNKQALDELIEGTTVKETGQMLRAASAFLKGKRGKNRFVVQLDNGEDVVCCNTATNAQYTNNSEITTVIYGESSIQFTNESEESFQKITNRLKIFGGGGVPYSQESEVCRNCKREKRSSSENKQCQCKQEYN